MEMEPNTAARTIVLVEDEDMVRQLLLRVLEREGYRVLAAGSGEEGLEILDREQRDPDLLLTDITLPGSVNGFELGRRALEEHREMKLVCMSGSSEDEMSDELMRRAVGASAFLGKPFSPAELVEMVHDVIGEAA